MSIPSNSSIPAIPQTTSDEFIPDLSNFLNVGPSLDSNITNILYQIQATVRAKLIPDPSTRQNILSKLINYIPVILEQTTFNYMKDILYYSGWDFDGQKLLPSADIGWLLTILDKTLGFQKAPNYNEYERVKVEIMKLQHIKIDIFDTIKILCDKKTKKH